MHQSAEEACNAYNTANELAIQMQGLSNMFIQPFFLTQNMLIDENTQPRVSSLIQQIPYPTNPILSIYPPVQSNSSITNDITRANFQAAYNCYTPITTMEQLKSVSQQYIEQNAAKQEEKLHQYEEELQSMKQQMQQLQKQLYEQEQQRLQKQYQDQQQQQQYQQQLQQQYYIQQQAAQQQAQQQAAAQQYQAQQPVMIPVQQIHKNESYSKGTHYKRIYSYRIPIKYNNLISRTDMNIITHYIRESLSIDEISSRTCIKMMDLHIIIMYMINDIHKKGHDYEYISKYYNIDTYDVSKYVDLYVYLTRNNMLQ